eukprot:6172478-Amphidinium_carterae.1
MPNVMSGRHSLSDSCQHYPRFPCLSVSCSVSVLVGAVCLLLFVCRLVRFGCCSPCKGTLWPLVESEALLKANDMNTTGSKVQLAARAADGEQLCIPRAYQPD